MGGGGGGVVGGPRSACVCVGEGGEEETLARYYLPNIITKLGNSTKIWYSTKMGVI